MGYTEDGKYIGKSIHKKDEKNRDILHIDYNKDNIEEYKREIIYDDINNIEIYKSYEKGVLTGYAIYTLDTSGKQIKHQVFDSNNNLLHETQYIYSAKGYQLTSYRKNKNSEEFNQYSFDDYGNITDHTYRSFSPLGSVTPYIRRTIYEYRYNEERKPIEILHLTPMNRENIKYVYSENNHISALDTTILGSDGIFRSRELKYYDINNNVVEEISYNSDNTIKNKSMFEFQYDEFGNWIKRTSYNWVEKFGKGYYEPITAEYRDFEYKASISGFLLY